MRLGFGPREDQQHNPLKPEMNAAVYFGDDGEFLILPLAKDAEGWRSEVNRPARLAWGGASPAVLGKAVLECLAVSAASIGHQPGETPAFMLASGAKTYRAFAKTRQVVNVRAPDGGGRLTVQFWRRNANYMYEGPPDERPDWTVNLPEDATPEQVGAAIIQVLQAGGIDTGPGIDNTSASDGPPSYHEFKNALISDYQVKAAQWDTPTEAITSLLEEIIRTADENPPLFVCAITTCALICLNQGFLPDYLDEPARHLGDISNQLSGQNLADYRADTTLLKQRLAAGPRIIQAPCPPDYFPGTWGPAAETASRAWWNNLLQGLPDQQT